MKGENLAWKAPYGGRSTPVVLGDRLYLENTAGSGANEQERLMCFNADTGQLLWEYKFNLYQSDVPAHRVGWAAPATDLETGNVYSFGVNNLLTALTRDGKKLWERSITEEFSPFTTHGGRTTSPIVDGDLVIVSTPVSTWGTMANRAQRFIALDKRTGDIIRISTPGGRPYDTSYSAMNIVNIDGTRLLITGGSDGAALAIKPQTGEPVWNLPLAKRGMNTGMVANGKYAIVSHGDENLEGNEMGLLAAFDATGKGKLGGDAIKWMVKGFMGGFSSPVIDGDRLYQTDDGANLHAFDVQTGKELWKQTSARGRKPRRSSATAKSTSAPRAASSSSSGRARTGATFRASGIPSAIKTGVAKNPEPLAAPPGARPRYFVSTDARYAIGPKGPRPESWKPVNRRWNPVRQHRVGPGRPDRDGPAPGATVQTRPPSIRCRGPVPSGKSLPPRGRGRDCRGRSTRASSWWDRRLRDRPASSRPRSVG